jgi:hypothetical protein
VLTERDFEVMDSTGKQLNPGRSGSTPTSQWGVADGSFQFASRKDGYHLSVTWEAPPATIKALDPFIMTIEAEIEGERPAAIALTPVINFGHRKKGHMQLEITAVSMGAKVVQGEVVGGTGKLFPGKAPGPHDAYFLELKLNGMAVARWTYVPQGAVE